MIPGDPGCRERCIRLVEEEGGVLCASCELWAIAGVVWGNIFRTDSI